MAGDSDEGPLLKGGWINRRNFGNLFRRYDMADDYKLIRKIQKKFGAVNIRLFS